MTHASNITGGIAPIEHISKIKEETGAYFVLDCAQTAGVLDIDFKKLQLDFLAFTGHKGLYGPPGTGGLILSDIAADEIVPLIHGGTGSKSDMEYQPDFMPDKMEAGTPNTIGIAGLYAGLNFVNEKGIKTIREHQTKLTKIFMEGLKELPRVRVFGQEEPDKRVAVVSIDVRGADLGELAYRLDNDYKIMIRSGLHCAPLAHKTIGTYPKGTLRFSFGSFNTEQEIMYCLKSLKEIIQKS